MKKTAILITTYNRRLITLKCIESLKKNSKFDSSFDIYIADSNSKDKTLQEINPVKHTFMGGCYIRELFMPKDQLAVTKIHKQENVFFIMKGSFSLLTEDGVLLIEAPYHGLTKIGTQRIMYVHEDTVFITVHSTSVNSVEEVERQIFAEDFNDPVITEEDLNILRNKK